MNMNGISLFITEATQHITVYQERGQELLQISIAEDVYNAFRYMTILVGNTIYTSNIVSKRGGAMKIDIPDEVDEAKSIHVEALWIRSEEGYVLTISW